MLAIREMEPRDEAAFVELWRQVHELHAGGRPDVYREFDRESVRAAFGELPSGNRGFALLAEADGVPAGDCVVYYKPAPDYPLLQPRRIAFLDDLCVDARFRGQGVGTRLLDAARERAALAGMERLELMVWSFNEAALCFYERAGMAERSRILELDLAAAPGKAAPGVYERTQRKVDLPMKTLMVKRLNPAAVLPRRATEGSAGYDLCAVEAVILPPHGIARVKTGIAIAIGDPAVVGLVYARSGLAAKHGIAPINCVGVIDSDYRGELQVPLANHGEAPFEIHPGDRIAQLVLSPVYTPELCETEELDETARGAGGFGSTGRGGE